MLCLLVPDAWRPAPAARGHSAGTGQVAIVLLGVQQLWWLRAQVGGRRRRWQADVQIVRQR
ncbi:MAG: hypothetical protein V9G23_18935 [Giesbergeria sp.]